MKLNFLEHVQKRDYEVSLLAEKQIVYGTNQNYGQIVFLAGGAGSGASGNGSGAGTSTGGANGNVATNIVSTIPVAAAAAASAAAPSPLSDQALISELPFLRMEAKQQAVVNQVFISKTIRQN
jgi:hypothetical protein